ncbi:family 10 glycosylhydrolase [Myxococcota bacterium]|nr:family 10 glycosylhydrolase [Myxococcota bacterium]
MSTVCLLSMLLACTPADDGDVRLGPTGDGGQADGGNADGGLADGGDADGGDADGGGPDGGDDGGGGDGGGGTADGGTADGGTAAEGGELRGVWLTRYEWASTSATGSELTETFGQIADAGFNAVFFQVRANFDAYYDSDLEPWASRLSGTLGQDPGWDPLAVAVEAAHARGLQVHAYLNVAPFWLGSTAPDSVGLPHAWQDHPEWVVADESGTPMALNDSYVYASLGNAQVRARTAAVAADVASRYDVDGIHLDYIRYPGSGYSHDAASQAAFAVDTAAGSAYPGLSWGDWQREMVKDVARQVSAAVDVPVTAAVWGIHTDEWGWGGVSEGNADYYQDSRAFLSEGLLDANLPMAYWEVTEPEGQALDFRVLTRDHVAHASGRHVYMGIGTYDIGYEETVRCIEAAREEGAHGVVLFSWSTVAPHADALRAGVFAEPALPPAMPWREAR